MLAETPYEVWDAEYTQEDFNEWIMDHEEEVKKAIKDEPITNIKVEDKYALGSFERRAAKYAKFRTEANRDMTDILMDAVRIQGRSVSRTCLFCCEEMHQVEYQKGIKVGDKLVLMQTAEWKMP